ncbi:MAG: hypothetical protein KBC12_02980 [Candidatus Pacebacteria bacterium]|nr:hypothetical protein [Candidatus Paceibacterota bacterium]MBP9851569.1 hypothetical protein [Candidatus Paceibacterota bacterium]
MFQPDKAAIESKENKAVKDCIQQLVLEHEYLGDPKNKQDLYKQIQSDWLAWVEERKITDGLDPNNQADYVHELLARVRRFVGGFGSSPKLYKILSKDTHRLDCLSGSMVIGSILEKSNIQFSYVSPVGHIALLVKIDGNNFYVDVGSNKFFEMKEEFIDRTESGKDFDTVFFKEGIGRGYSFFAVYKNPEDVLGSVFGNIVVLDEVLKGDTSNASSNPRQQIAAADSIKNEIQKVDFKNLRSYLNQFPDFRKTNKTLCAAEVERLKSIGFYNED